jgi:hypothetical protein
MLLYYMIFLLYILFGPLSQRFYSEELLGPNELRCPTDSRHRVGIEARFDRGVHESYPDECYHGGSMARRRDGQHARGMLESSTCSSRQTYLAPRPPAPLYRHGSAHMRRAAGTHGPGVVPEPGCGCLTQAQEEGDCATRTGCPCCVAAESRAASQGHSSWACVWREQQTARVFKEPNEHVRTKHPEGLERCKDSSLQVNCRAAH